jgi:outer membrane lipoprotein-sorting protein
MRRYIWLFFLPFLSFAQSAEDVALRVESKIRSLDALRANFEHIYYSSSVSTPLTEKGRFFYKKPGVLKWEYLDPEEKIFLYEDGLFQSYYPEENQLIQNSLSEEEGESEFLSLLTGRIDLQNNYSVIFSSFPSDEPNSYQLKLTPKGESQDAYILLEIDKKKWLIRKAISFDWTGNKSEFVFTQIKVNPSLSKDTFRLNLPPDVEIIKN